MISYTFIKFCCLIFFVSIINSCTFLQKDSKKSEVENSLIIPVIGKSEGAESTGQNIDFQMKLWQNGIDFYARGNEPSWSLDMDFDKNFQFSTMDGFKISVPPVNGDNAKDAKVTRYYAEVESGTLIITIQEQKCSDSMSDHSFNFKISVRVKFSNEELYSEYQGCGNYVPDYSLHDIWLLTTLNGMDLKSKVDGGHQPIFEFYARGGKMRGNTSCNDFEGSYYHSGNREIHFGDMAMTKKLCPDMEIEKLLIKSVFGRRMKYSKEKMILRFAGYDNTEIIFKKID